MKSRRKKLTLTLTFLILVGISSLCKAESIYDLTKAIERNPNDADAYYRRGKAYYEADLKIRAIADFTMAIQLKPDFGDAYLERARAYTFMSYSSEKGRYDLAIADCAKAIELDPNNADAYEACGSAYYWKDDYDNAIANFTKAIELDSNNADAYDSRSFAYDKAGDYVRAAVDHMKAKKLNPDTSNLGGVYGKYFGSWNKSYKEEARAYYAKIITGLTKLIQSNPDDALVYCARGMAYYKKSTYYLLGQKDLSNNDHARAIYDYTKAIELDPNYAHAYYFLGELFTIGSSPDDDLAISNYTKAIQLKPDFYFAYGGRARAYVRQKNYTLALVDRTISIQMSHNFNGQWGAEAYDNRATVYELMGDYDRAIADYTKAMEFDSTLTDICRYKRGWMYRKKGDYDLAIADFYQGHSIGGKIFRCRSLSLYGSWGSLLG